MMTPRQARERLRLPLRATPEEVRRAHRRSLQDHHPDKGGNAKDAQLDNEAKDVLLQEGTLEAFNPLTFTFDVSSEMARRGTAMLKASAEQYWRGADMVTEVLSENLKQGVRFWRAFTFT